MASGPRKNPKHQPTRIGRSGHPVDVECSECGASTRNHPSLSEDGFLTGYLGRACPYCGEGLIRRVEDYR